MQKVYRLDYYEPYEPDLKYEELYKLGYFESRERCMKEIKDFYQFLPGFKDGALGNYRITEKIIDGHVNYAILKEMKDKNYSIPAPSIFWELVHGYDTIEEGYTVASIVGVYSSKEWAELMKAEIENWDIFKLHSEPHMDGEFHIDRCVLNKRWHEDGFIRGVPLTSNNLNPISVVKREPFVW